ncbi:hypothetical protein GIB67_037952 [Kingdonia uniflora]|uniref:UBC core domain-containing protein n=1 Tax=Kingdonia uniflora TaxID=39325 RepID=A0A7J7LHJ2_9MAGN|nr:hypothetical protein GIB67_037952 [Kingdonia uniflora]
MCPDGVSVRGSRGWSVVVVAGPLLLALTLISSTSRVSFSTSRLATDCQVRRSSWRRFPHKKVVLVCPTEVVGVVVEKGSRTQSLNNPIEPFRQLRYILTTIFVRVYEERINLLRAAIVGAPGTPYHDGLFFFDFFLPSDYPNEPPHFETLVEEHFRSRSHSILLACEAYMDGAPVGWGTAEGETRKSCSTGFKIMLAKLFPKLVAGFMASGIDCRQFLERKNH